MSDLESSDCDLRRFGPKELEKLSTSLWMNMIFAREPDRNPLQRRDHLIKFRNAVLALRARGPDIVRFNRICTAFAENLCEHGFYILAEQQFQETFYSWMDLWDQRITFLRCCHLPMVHGILKRDMPDEGKAAALAEWDHFVFPLTDMIW
ncbi:hypothetical protein MMC20_001061 [Loxospora ochrophaea]|nr:hypothetical protein [Loxospora ochrophaea]